MCLGIPGKIVEIQGSKGRMDIGGVFREVDLTLISEISIGEYVLAHAGFAIEKLNEEEALQTLQLLRELAQAGETP